MALLLTSAFAIREVAEALNIFEGALTAPKYRLLVCNSFDGVFTPGNIPDRPSRIPRSVFAPRLPGPNTWPLKAEEHQPQPILTPRSPGPNIRRSTQEKPAAKRVAFQLLPWKLTTVNLNDRSLTRPPRYLLHIWDIRVRRYTSPTGPWSVPTVLSPLPPSPIASLTRSTQTQLPRVHRGVQAQPLCLDQATQSNSDWETPCSDKGV